MKSSWVIFMLMCLSIWLYGTDPVIPLLSFQWLSVLSQEQMAKPAPPVFPFWKRYTFFPRLPPASKCTAMRMCLLATSSQNQKNTAAQEGNLMRHAGIRRCLEHKSCLRAPFLLWLPEIKNKGVTELRMSDCQKLHI